jgi:DNA end-binding protein Ku
MTMRALASAMLSFGMVQIPVRLYSATESAEKISFNLLHKGCGGRLSQRYVCEAHKGGDVVVEADERVKGYEHSKGEYVHFSTEELAALEEPALESIEVLEFVRLGQVDTTYFDGRYYLGPDKGADHAYKLLAQALLETGRAGLCKFALRKKQHMALVISVGDKLVLQQLHYAAEVRSLDDIEVKDVTITDAELKLATQVIIRMGKRSCNLAAYEDVGRRRLQEQIDRKVKGHQIVAAPSSAAAPAPIVDLLEALQASLTKPRRTSPARRRRAHVHQ